MPTATDVNAVWWPLFDPCIPDDTVLRSVFAGRCPGSACVDRMPDPTEVVVRAHGGETFASVGCSPEFLRGAIEAARATGPVVLFAPDIPESVSACGEVVERTQFLDCDLEGEQLENLQRLPPDLLM